MKNNNKNHLLIAALIAGTCYSSVSMGDDHYSRPFTMNIRKVRTPDQILNAMSRRIYLPSTKIDQLYNLSLEFSKNNIKEIITINDLEVRGKHDKYVILDISEYSKLEKKYSGSVAYISAESVKSGDELFKKERPKLFIASSKIDYKCQKPVLIADMNGTLDTGDQCTVDTLNMLDEKYKLPIFVVSSLGMGAAPALKTIGLKDDRNVLVLANSNELLGISDYMGGGEEKAFRVIRQITSAGLCALGFAGDSLTSDGNATELMDSIPFYPVNIPGRHVSKKVETKYNEYFCSLKKEIPVTKDIENCEAPYSIVSHKINESKFSQTVGERCQKMKKIAFNISDTRYIGPKKIGTPIKADSCTDKFTFRSSIFYKKIGEFYEDGSQSDFRNGVNLSGRYRLIKKCEIKKEMILSTKNKEIPLTCKHEKYYQYGTREKIVEHYEYSRVPRILDMSKYPESSIQQKNWCELGSTLITKIDNLQMNGESDEN